MKSQTINSVSYCFDLLCFVFQNNDIGEKINTIYLFGSAVRGELTKESDIDLFFDCNKENEIKVKGLVDSGIIKFLSSRDYEKWKLLHFTYPFSIHIGKLDEWDLKLSIASEGFLLYSKRYVLNVGERCVLFKIQYPKKKKIYIKIRRLLFGRDEDDYKGKGIIQSMNGKKISSDVFIIPKGEQTKIIDLLTKEKVDFSMTEVVNLDW
ncbi:MAG: nucleotidyltransferase domain-containing protein [Nanoarchaeota archaeon]